MCPALADGMVIVQGVYFQWNNEPVNPTVKEWNVKEMRVSHSYLVQEVYKSSADRHIDRQIEEAH